MNDLKPLESVSPEALALYDLLKTGVVLTCRLCYQTDFETDVETLLDGDEAPDGLWGVLAEIHL